MKQLHTESDNESVTDRKCRKNVSMAERQYQTGQVGDTVYKTIVGRNRQGQGQTGTDRGRQAQTGADRSKQRQTDRRETDQSRHGHIGADRHTGTDRDGLRQTATDREIKLSSTVQLKYCGHVYNVTRTSTTTPTCHNSWPCFYPLTCKTDKHYMSARQTYTLLT